MSRYDKNIGLIIIETATTNQEYPMNIKRHGSNGFAIAEGVLQDADVLNRNKRIYSKGDLFPEIKSQRTQELIKTGNMRGENGHPLATDLTRQQTIDPDKTCCIFLSMWTEDNLVKATYRGTNNEKGKEFNDDLLDGFLPSFSLRALGRVVETKRGAEVKGLKLITYDRVIYPSHKRAYTTKLLSESGTLMDRNTEGNKLFVEHNDTGMLIPIQNEAAIQYIKDKSMNFKQVCESFEFMYKEITLEGEFKNQIKMVNYDGDIVYVQLENWITNEIMGTCVNLANRR